MCQYTTLVVPPTDLSSLARTLASKGRQLEPTANASLAKHLQQGDQQYILSRRSGQCDCGSVLGRDADDMSNTSDDLARDVDKFRRKRWSESKIQRSLGHRAESNRQKIAVDFDSFEYWAQLLTELIRTFRFPRVGLFVHNYHGPIDSEVLPAVAVKTLRIEQVLTGVENLAEDNLLYFHVRLPK